MFELVLITLSGKYNNTTMSKQDKLLNNLHIKQTYIILMIEKKIEETS